MNKICRLIYFDTTHWSIDNVLLLESQNSSIELLNIVCVIPAGLLSEHSELIKDFETRGTENGTNKRFFKIFHCSLSSTTVIWILVSTNHHAPLHASYATRPCMHVSRVFTQLSNPNLLAQISNVPLFQSNKCRYRTFLHIARFYSWCFI